MTIPLPKRDVMRDYSGGAIVPNGRQRGGARGAVRQNERAEFPMPQ